MRYATLGGAQIFVGAAAIFARYALGGAGPMAVSALRLSIAALVVLAVLAARGPRASIGKRGEWVLAIAGAALAVHFAGWIASLQYTSIAIATLLVCTSPIFTAVFDAAAGGRRPTRWFWGALACGTAGLWLVVAARNAPAPIPGYPVLGACLAVTGAVAMAVYLTIVRTVRGGLGTLTIVSRTYAWAAIVLVPVMLIAHEKPPAISDASAWFGILAMALISQLLGHTAMNNALRWFTPTTIGFSTLLEPPIAASLGAAIFGETLAATTLAGGLLLLAAIGFALRDQPAAVVTEL